MQMCRGVSLQHIRRMKIVQKIWFRFLRPKEGKMHATISIALKVVGGVVSAWNAGK